MTLIDTSWLLHGESPVPEWVIAVLLVAGIFVSIWWLKGEKRRKGFSGKLLPYTWTLLLALAIWLAWNPTLVKITKWENEGRILVWLDTSESMETKLLGKNLSANLDFLSLWHPEAVRDRVTAPGRLKKEIQNLVQEGTQIQQILNKVQEEFAQAIPLGDSSRDAKNRYNPWASMTRTNLREAITGVQNVVDRLAQNQRADLPLPSAELDLLAKQVELLPEMIDKPSTRLVRDALQSLSSFIQTGRLCLSSLVEFQAAMDERFYAEHEAGLKPILEKMENQSRLDIARRLLSGPPDKDAMVLNESVRHDETDIYGSLENLLAEREGEVVSHVLVLSDGGQNVGSNSDEPEKLKKSGIGLIAVGIGVPEAGFDLAILDWQAKRVVRANRMMKIAVQVKTPKSMEVPFKLRLLAGDRELANASFTTNGRDHEEFDLEYQAPEEGRYILSLRIESEDVNPHNNEVRFVIDAVKRTPQVILVGEQPDWDTTYLSLAVMRAGFEGRQLYHGFEKDQPRRGSSTREIPKTLAHWSRNRLVILQGVPFRGFKDEDADALFHYVTERGGSLVIMAGADQSWVSELASRFGWQEKTRAVGNTRVLLSPGAAYFPLVRLGIDGPQSARIIRSLGRCENAVRVPSQNAVLLENEQQAPLLSLGFYGKGKVYLWGLKGIYRLREYRKAEWVDRLLTQLVEDAVAPLFADEKIEIAFYPVMPVPGKENFLVSLAPDADQVFLEERVQLQIGVSNRIGEFSPRSVGRIQAKVNDSSAEFYAAANPGMEDIYFEFNGDFLKQFALESDGQYVPLEEAEKVLQSIRPAVWRHASAERYPLANHWSLMCLIALVGTVHWSLRKFSGLPM